MECDMKVPEKVYVQGELSSLFRHRDHGVFPHDTEPARSRVDDRGREDVVQSLAVVDVGHAGKVYPTRPLVKGMCAEGSHTTSTGKR